MEPDLLLLLLILNIDFGLVGGVLLFFLLLVCSALISGSEVSLFSLSSTHFNERENQSTKEKIIYDLLERPKKLLATILVANNFINIAIVLLYSYLKSNFNFIDQEGFYGVNIEFIIDLSLVTFLILFFGEILPKVYANRNQLNFALFMAYPLLFLDKLLILLTVPMRNTTKFLERNLGKQKMNLSVDQLSQALELTRDEETSKEEKKILQGIVTFGNTDVKQVMRPRMDIFAFSKTLTFKEVITKITENGYSRIPVYAENIDHIEGILYIKDLLPYLKHKDFEWFKLSREPYFVPENKKLDDLLNDFKDQKKHLAIVVDEYGGTSGLITLEDIIEEIVGEISDEYDDEDIMFSKLDNNTFIFEGKTALKDMYNILKIEDESIFEEFKGEAETIAGFVLEIAKNFPKLRKPIYFENYTFSVEVIEDRRLKQIKVKVKP